MEHAETVQQTMAEYCAAKGITSTAERIPARTDGSGSEWQADAFHWRVTLRRGNDTFPLEYSCGSAHASLRRVPGWMPGEWVSCVKDAANPKPSFGHGVKVWCKVTPTPPTTEDVLDSLRSDAESVAWSTFEDWCLELGYDTDSRRAERSYHACQENAQRLRLFLGVQDIMAEFENVDRM